MCDPELSVNNGTRKFISPTLTAKQIHLLNWQPAHVQQTNISYMSTTSANTKALDSNDTEFKTTSAITWRLNSNEVEYNNHFRYN